jgi:hypothetical protein
MKKVNEYGARSVVAYDKFGRVIRYGSLVMLRGGAEFSRRRSLDAPLYLGPRNSDIFKIEDIRHWEFGEISVGNKMYLFSSEDIVRVRL